MTNPSSQKENVRQFFDRLAHDYSKRYSDTDAYYAYFFKERLEKSTSNERGLPLRILDVGAGTGALYDYLVAFSRDIDYYGLDISAAMLEASQVPKDRQIVGNFPQSTANLSKFDRVFLLGVTTYFSRNVFSEVLQGVVEQLAPGGEAVITFTNRLSFDHFVRMGLKWLALSPLFSKLLKKQVFGQNFQIEEYSESDVRQMLPAELEMTECVYINHTSTPFNRLLPGLSVQAAKLLRRLFGQTGVIKYLSADFIVRFKKR